MDDEIETIGLVAVTKLCDDEIMKKKKKNLTYDHKIQSCMAFFPCQAL